MRPFSDISLLLHSLPLHFFLVALLNLWAISSVPTPAGGEIFFILKISLFFNHYKIVIIH